MPKKLSQFWQELKRRNVIRVITVYAGAAFVLLELVDILAPSLGLPNWTLNLVLVLLIIGFVVAVIVSWIYDIHPEDGIVKSDLTEKEKVDEIPKSSIRWKIASYISFVLILALIILNILPRVKGSNERTILDKSIAVLPFESLSVDKNLQYQADGVMDAILLHLSKIEDLRVMSRTSVEQFRGTKKTVPEICEELGVAYVLEGSFQKSGDQIRLIVQLIQSGKEGHIWANNYDREWKDIFSVQSEVAQRIATELQAAITPAEKELIERIPTTSLTAYDFYQKGREEHFKYWTDIDNKAALQNAEDYYFEALKYDSTFAQAYTGLAWVYRNKNYWNEYFSGTFLDSALKLTDIALSYDAQLGDAYLFRGRYYRTTGNTEQAIKEYDKAILYNPNDYMGYYYKAVAYSNLDVVKCIENMQKAASRDRGALPAHFTVLGMVYRNAGFFDLARRYWEEALKLDGDSARFYLLISQTEQYSNHKEQAINLYQHANRLDASRNYVDLLSYVFYGKHDLAASFQLFDDTDLLLYCDQYMERVNTHGEFGLANMHRIGYAYWISGDEPAEKHYFNKQVEYCQQQNQLGRTWSEQLFTYYDLAAIAAFRGNFVQAYENLNTFKERNVIHLWMLWDMKNDPLFDTIRDDHDFQQIIREMEAKYQAEHERIWKWLEANDML